MAKLYGAMDQDFNKMLALGITRDMSMDETVVFLAGRVLELKEAMVRVEALLGQTGITKAE